MPIPDLPHSCGSWIAVDRKTGKAVRETYERATAERLDAAGYEVLTALAWLQRVNADLKTQHKD